MDSEIKVLEKGLDYAPIQNKINEPELRNDFEEFCRWMCLKWYFRNEPSSEFNETPSLTPKSLWKPSKGHLSLEVLLSEIKKEIFAIPDSRLDYSNLLQKEWQTMQSLADDRSIVIKKADKGSSVVVWDCYDYIEEAEKQLKNQNIYKDIEFTEKILQDLAETRNKMFRSLKTKEKIDEKQLKYFKYEHKKTCNLGKLSLLPKIHKRLHDVGKPIISNCGTPTEKILEFLDRQLKPIIQKCWSYIKDSGDFIRKIKNLTDIPESSILVTGDVAGLYPSIPHQPGLETP